MILWSDCTQLKLKFYNVDPHFFAECLLSQAKVVIFIDSDLISINAFSQSTYSQKQFSYKLKGVKLYSK